MLTQHLAIVPEEDGLSLSDLARVSAAIQKQVTRDVSPIWSVRATVDVFPELSDVPVGYLPVLIGSEPLPDEGAVYLDERGQPFGRVRATRGSLAWSVAASRVCLEMLVNPYGERTITAPSVRSDQGLVEVWLDVWGPCADEGNTYAVNEILVADFCTPAYFGQAASGGIDRCSFRGAVPLPLHVPRGGHLAWYDPVSHAYWLRQYWSDNPVDLQWESADRRGSLREWIRSVRTHRAVPAPRGAQDWLGLRPRRPVTEIASEVRAQRLRAYLTAQTASVRPRAGAAAELVHSEEREPTSYFESVEDAELKPADTAHLPEPVDASEPDLPKALSSDVETAPTAVAAPQRAQPVDGPVDATDKAEAPLPPSPHSTLAPVAVAAPPPAPPARHGVSLLFGAAAGAALVMLLWSQQHTVARSSPAAAPQVTPPPRTAAVQPTLAAAPAAKATPAAEPSVAAKSVPLEVPAGKQGPKRTTRLKKVTAREVPAASGADAGAVVPGTKLEPSLEALVDSRE